MYVCVSGAVCGVSVSAAAAGADDLRSGVLHRGHTHLQDAQQSIQGVCMYVCMSRMCLCVLCCNVMQSAVRTTSCKKWATKSECCVSCEGSCRLGRPAAAISIFLILLLAGGVRRRGQAASPAGEQAEAGRDGHARRPHGQEVPRERERWTMMKDLHQYCMYVCMYA